MPLQTAINSVTGIETETSLACVGTNGFLRSGCVDGKEQLEAVLISRVRPYMSLTRDKPPWTRILILLFVGLVPALWAIHHANRAPVELLLSCMLVFGVCGIWAALLFNRWREAMLSTARVRTVSPSQADAAQLVGTLYGLTPDVDYWVQQDFIDYYGNHFHRGEQLRFKSRSFLPYHGGHTIMFAEKGLYLQEDENQEILQNFSQYITAHEP